MDHLYISLIYLISSLALEALAVITTAMYKAKEFDHRYTKPGSVWMTIYTSLSVCCNNCFVSPNCVTFNYNRATQSCEMLNTARYLDTDANMVSAPGWNYYHYVPPARPPNANDYCPQGSVYVQYEQPVYLKYDLSLDGYACTNDNRIVAEDNQGKECIMRIIYDVDFQGSDTAYMNQPVQYYDAWKECITYSCVGMICMKTGNCWLKKENHLTVSTQTIPDTRLLYWYPDCT